ncbi:MAG TPA: acetyl-CoA carboxylase carboxyltransferase subunit alpha [Syntrophorhabdaceae bacterium]|nr:acetyl-CoA carboxylase carboxyltransferase subunit alpha [Syntrophorhabdaceae bacterium]HOL05748.1 acetyl-CoA carboxylase carboxyltransferase subunit alpha [Syntrophorhabdaceae bacterium]HON85567.1 acetyl-CoA carboxylase carboxyltransferase subunit alpha [Syntrophorhabdaceae bacterium]HOT42454.1 acetyl-CoA carboxylase carboxyltransferase subunit alpha [Syntrophorhabdaceae bacterium]HPC66488.1 acetyl-CoA carboxylase carboxyltransferase subunit alpha [Syntrophorhabdaceae bacterium]
MRFYLDFEKRLEPYERRINEIKKFYSASDPRYTREIQSITKKIAKLEKEIYGELTNWQRSQLSRHLNRPHTLDYIENIFTDFVEFHGDRKFKNDPAVVAGFARFGGNSVAVVGHQKGKDVREMAYRNFGMSHPEGYRKAVRVMELANRWGKPIVTFIDTPGAFPGIGAEERGQAEAIASSIEFMFSLSVPVITVVIGEGGSGGALAIGVGNIILMLENATYSVISPEGCAAILWRDGSKGPLAAEALKPTANDLFRLNVIDEIVKEPFGGAHRDWSQTFDNLRPLLSKYLKELSPLPAHDLKKMRYEKFRKMGIFEEK